MKYLSLRKLLIAVFLLFQMNSYLFAQPGGPGGGPTGTPIDGGSLFLLGAGAAYVVKRFWKRANRQE